MSPAKQSAGIVDLIDGMEAEAAAIVDKLGMVELVLAKPCEITPQALRAIVHLIGDAACAARGLEADLSVARETWSGSRPAADAVMDQVGGRA